MSTRIRFYMRECAAATRPAFTMAEQARKRTQRERLVTGMVNAANRGGYAGATVAAVIAEAGVSRPTFYDYFADREDCFRTSVAEVQRELVETVDRALAGCEPAEATAVAVRALLAYASAHPARARFVMAESMAGGAGALQARDRGAAQIAGAIEHAQSAAAKDERIPDVNAHMLVGCVYRTIARRLRRGESAVGKLADELTGWLASYERAAARRRWQDLRPAAEPPRSPYLPQAPLQRMPDVLPPGRVWLSEAEVAENHRLRILHAVAMLAVQKGYTATTVADVQRLARIEGRVFYRHFADKQDAFEALHELGFQLVLDVSAKAFFAVDGWPRRSWEAARALTQLLQENPLIAHIGFVEAYAVGPSAVQRIEDSHVAFMFFLQEGLAQRAQGEELPTRVGMEAILDCVFEIVYLQVRRGDRMQVAGMLPHVAHVWLTPFIGARKADALIARMGARA